MKSLILYSKEQLRGIRKADNIFTLCLVAVALPIGLYEYGLYATIVTIFIFYAVFTLFEIVFSGREIFAARNLKNKNSVEQGRLIYHLIALMLVFSGMLYLQSKAVNIFIAGLTLTFCFTTGISILYLKFKK